MTVCGTVPTYGLLPPNHLAPDPHPAVRHGVVGTATPVAGHVAGTLTSPHEHPFRPGELVMFHLQPQTFRNGLKLCLTLLVSCILIIWFTRPVRSQPTTYIIPLLNPLGAPTHCWQTQEGAPSYYGYGGLIRFTDLRGADVLVRAAVVASSPDAAGVDPARCAGGRDGLLGRE